MAQSAKKIFNYTFSWENTPLMMRASSFLPRTPDFYLCPKIPGGGQ